MISPKPEQPIDVYSLIRQAIEQKQQVLATYQGYYREMCPHAIGVNKRGEPQALFYQFGGESRRPLGPPGSPHNWRCIPINELTDVSVRDGEWHTAGNHTRRESCVFHRLDLAVIEYPSKDSAAGSTSREGRAARERAKTETPSQCSPRSPTPR